MNLKRTLHITWLFNEIELWLKDGIITEDHAALIRKRYESPDTSPVGRIVFTAIGSVIFGLGIILLIAYNWEDIPKTGKLLLIFASLGAAHWGGYTLMQRGGGNEGVGEGLHILGTMLFGAGIWLIAQVYHIDEHYPNGLLAWGIGAWALAWALPSIAQGLLGVVILSFWGGFEALDFDSPVHISTFIILLCSMPLAWVKKSRVLLFTGAAAAYIIFIFNTTASHERTVLTMMLLAASVYVLLGYILRENTGFPESGPVLSTTGFIPYLGVLYLLTFDDVARNLLTGYRIHISHGYLWFMTVFITLLFALSMFILYTKRQHLRDTLRLNIFGAYASSMILTYIQLTTEIKESLPASSNLDATAYVIIFNLIFLFHSFSMIWEGISEMNMKRTYAGAALLALLAFSRYADLFESLLARAGVFLAVGLFIIGIGIFYSRIKRSQEAAL